MSILRNLFRLLPSPLRDRLRKRIHEFKVETLAEMQHSLELQQQARDAIRDAQIQARLSPTESRLRILETHLHQLGSTLAQEQPSLLPPPRDLQVRVAGAYVKDFIDSGPRICDDLDAVLGVAGKQLSDFPRILDFGCGSGRATRALALRVPSSRIFGTDIDAEAIGWLAAHYGRFAEFRAAPHQPPTSYEDHTFDLVVGISVFTHLPEAMQFEWLEELRRITKPGGYLILTTAGEKHYKNQPAETQKAMREKGFFYSDSRYGQSVALPAFYQNTWHAHHYIRSEWARYFEVVDIQADRVQSDQDAVLLRTPPDPDDGSS